MRTESVCVSRLPARTNMLCICGCSCGATNLHRDWHPRVTLHEMQRLEEQHQPHKFTVWSQITNTNYSHRRRRRCCTRRYYATNISSDSMRKLCCYQHGERTTPQRRRRWDAQILAKHQRANYAGNPKSTIYANSLPSTSWQYKYKRRRDAECLLDDIVRQHVV